MGCTPDSHRANVRGETSTCRAAFASDRPRVLRRAFSSDPVITWPHLAIHSHTTPRLATPRTGKETRENLRPTTPSPTMPRRSIPYRAEHCHTGPYLTTPSLVTPCPSAYWKGDSCESPIHYAYHTRARHAIHRLDSPSLGPPLHTRPLFKLRDVEPSIRRPEITEPDQTTSIRDHVVQIAAPDVFRQHPMPYCHRWQA